MGFCVDAHTFSRDRGRPEKRKAPPDKRAELKMVEAQGLEPWTR